MLASVYRALAPFFKKGYLYSARSFWFASGPQQQDGRRGEPRRRRRGRGREEEIEADAPLLLFTEELRSARGGGGESPCQRPAPVYTCPARVVAPVQGGKQ